MSESIERGATDDELRNVHHTPVSRHLPGILALDELGDRAIIFESGLAKMFDRCETSVKRAVDRGELPPPARLFGKPVWTVRAILEHLETRLDNELRDRKALDEKVHRMKP